MRHVCIHAHFYQPPRENPWLEEVELQDSAYPYHDWNDRIAAECYERNAASRLLDGERRIVDIVNNYARISFNFGPTLLSWMERRRPELLEALVEADRQSRERFSGHGSALAQAYGHMILPLASARDKETQVRWGIEDFRRRFGRDPEGMWLPEAAVDRATLEVLADHGIRFTVLAPRQAARVRALSGGPWADVGGDRVDPKHPYLCRLPSGRSVVLFFYDGPVSQDVAFAGLLNDGRAFADRLLGAFSDDPEGPELVHISTDGETYGHHHRHGDMALAYCLHHLESQGLARTTVYGAYLEENPPTREVEIFDESSWSCVHGVERWRADCGCSSGMNPGWSQAWRGPLREAMDWLRDALTPVYEREAGRLLRDPWDARDAYVGVILDRSPENVRAFLGREAGRELEPREEITALKLLELQRHAMLMFTSCGWFFDEISGIETVQVMQYAARAIQLAREVGGPDLEPAYLEHLGRAPSNVLGDGARIYEAHVRPAALDLLRVGSHYAVSSLFEEYEDTARIFSYTAESEAYERREAGLQTLVMGRARVRSEVTWEESHASFAVLHLGDHNISGGVRDFLGPEDFAAMAGEVRGAFLRSDVPGVIRLIDRHFGSDTYSLWHLFRDEQRKVLRQIRYSTLDEVDHAYRNIYQRNYSLMTFLHGLGTPIPRAYRLAAGYTVSADLTRPFEEGAVDPGELERLLEEAARWALEIDRQTLGFVASGWVGRRMAAWAEDPDDSGPLGELVPVLRLLSGAGVELDLWRAQNLHFSAGRALYPAMRERAPEDPEAAEWVDRFAALGDLLGIRVDR